MLRTYISEMTFNNGSTIAVPPRGTVIIVGPNNSGKSAALRNIRDQIVSASQEKHSVVTSTKIERQGDDDALADWLHANCDHSVRDGVDTYSRPGAGTIRLSEAKKRWNAGNPFRELGRIFMFFGAAQERLQAADSANNRDTVNDPPTHPLHKLDDDFVLMRRLREIALATFESPLTLNRHAGSKIHLHVGEVAAEEMLPDGPEFLAYREQLRALPLLVEQGDGMKSFIGLLLNMTIAHYPFLVVDEPEAFLHPPQALQLGRAMFEARNPDSQLFLATHDVNVLRGLLEAGDESVTIVRITRDGQLNPIKVLTSVEISKLWNDPLLRYSEILSGIFHQGVVLCESDADCRFYQSILDDLVETGEIPRPPELLFVHCGGKHRMDSVIRALNAVGFRFWSSPTLMYSGIAIH